MKSLKFIAGIFLVGALLVFNSCKDEEDPTPLASKTELLTASPWKPTQIKFGDFTGPVDDCTADDVHTFTANGTYTFDEGPTKCEEDDPQSYSGTWSFNTAETFLNISEDGFTFEKEILELSATTMRLKFSFFGVEIEETYGK